MPKVLHVINGEFYAGAERVQDLLALNLPDQGFEVGFACLKARDFPPKRLSKDTPVHALPMRSRFDMRAAINLARLSRRHNFDLLHTHSPRSALIAAFASFFCALPIVHHAHSPTSRDTENPLRNIINTITEKAALQRVRKLIAVSGSLQEHLLHQGIPAEKISIVHNGVPGPKSSPNTKQRGASWTIGCCAYYRPRKGLEILLRAAARLVAEGRQLTLRLVGDFETRDYEKAIRHLCSELGLDTQTQWIGFSNNVFSELAKMDIFILPSLFGEGLPMVVLEAMAAGLPVIASDIDGVPEAVRHGREGLLFQPGSEKGLAQAVDDIITGGYDWHRLSEHCRLRHQEQFSDSRMARQVALVYEQLLQQHAHGGTN